MVERIRQMLKSSQARRSAQTALHRVTYALARMLAPVLAFTMEEVWSHLRKPADAPPSIHLASFPKPAELVAGMPAETAKPLANWDRLIAVRDEVLKSLETARQEKFIGAPLEAKVRLSAAGELYPLLGKYKNDLPALFIVSQVELENHAVGPMKVTVEKADGVKCERCWKYTLDHGSDPELPTVCGPCAAAVREMAS